MDDDLRNRLFDPQAAHGLVLARRPPSRSAVADVVSDVVWHDVVVLLRWAAAGTRGAPELEAGRWWRLASGCADLLRRLPGLSDELEEPWQPVGTAEIPAGTGRDRIERGDPAARAPAAVARLPSRSPSWRRRSTPWGQRRSARSPRAPALGASRDPAAARRGARRGGRPGRPAHAPAPGRAHPLGSAGRGAAVVRHRPVLGGDDAPADREPGAAGPARRPRGAAVAGAGHPPPARRRGDRGGRRHRSCSSGCCPWAASCPRSTPS